MVRMVKVTDLHLANVGSTPAGTHTSHWWQQAGHRHCRQMSRAYDVYERWLQNILNIR